MREFVSTVTETLLPVQTPEHSDSTWNPVSTTRPENPLRTRTYLARVRLPVCWSHRKIDQTQRSDRAITQRSDREVRHRGQTFITYLLLSNSLWKAGQDVKEAAFNASKDAI